MFFSRVSSINPPIASHFVKVQAHLNVYPLHTLLLRPSKCLSRFFNSLSQCSTCSGVELSSTIDRRNWYNSILLALKRLQECPFGLWVQEDCFIFRTRRLKEWALVLFDIRIVFFFFFLNFVIVFLLRNALILDDWLGVTLNFFTSVPKNVACPSRF